jgi:hypothetical protein
MVDLFTKTEDILEIVHAGANKLKWGCLSWCWDEVTAPTVYDRAISVSNPRTESTFKELEVRYFTYLYVLLYSLNGHK